MDRTRINSKTVGDSDDYKSRDEVTRVNVYHATGATTDEKDKTWEVVTTILDEVIFQTDLEGVDLNQYTLDFSINSSESGGSHELIDMGYNKLEEGGYRDEHCISYWIYWSADSKNGQNFMMGHDISNDDDAYPATHRQPYKYIEPSDMEEYDVLQGFLYLNEYDDNAWGERKFSAIAHELCHGLQAYSAWKDRYSCDDCDEQVNDHYLGTSFNINYEDSAATVMTLSQNSEATQNGPCVDEKTWNDRIEGSNCLFEAIDDSIDYWSNNTDI
ncbi:hypothetical protein EGH22_20625 [Halomicroarcula sp. F28]|uniref:hypothetical protein n=1 Tax=Haloarcula salinisoli TaxID=2487746 RepID=UPI001C7324D0|nr:hypothetical protein [Halomicroarcula salinisoli]MBX0288739.1 hypothetical protein [Halomicroarcula salinisoli]